MMLYASQWSLNDALRLATRRWSSSRRAVGFGSSQHRSVQGLWGGQNVNVNVNANVNANVNVNVNFPISKHPAKLISVIRDLLCFEDFA